MSYIDSLQSSTCVDNIKVSKCDGITSPLREIAPKFVVGSKKYGRRSRPHCTTNLSEESSSDSENEQIPDDISQSLCIETTSHKVQRSASQNDLNLSKRRILKCDSKLKRCASLPAQKNSKYIEKKNNNNKKVSSVSSVPKVESSLDSLGE